MLVLSRTKGESIVIDDTITVTVLSVRGDKVRIGIAAAPHITIDRAEVAEKKGIKDHGDSN